MFNLQEFHQKRQGNFGKELYYFETIDSTNHLAEKLAREQAAEGTVVIANEQTMGKGSKTNAWYSPPDQNLYFSLILYPQSARLQYLPFMAGLAIIRALRILGLQPDLKWPNDVLVSEKKISGILLQTSVEENRLQFAIIGCGLNVNVRQFPSELQETATSIALEKGDVVSRESVLASVLLEFETLYGKIEEILWSELCEEVEKSSSYVRGCTVEITEGEKKIQGITQGLDSYGGLLLETIEGRKVFYSGDIQSCRRK